MKKLEVVNLHVEVDGVEIIKGLDLVVQPGTVHVLMGPNGSGKSTLANTLMGHPKYKVTQGKIALDGKDITSEKANVRAKEGLFLSFQYPSEVTGVTMNSFLRTALNNLHGKKYNVLEFNNILKDKMTELKMDFSFSKRYLNEGFSGGEKKRAEILQLAMIEPKYALLDETDSGLDVDAIKIVADGINKLKQKGMGVLLITHYNRFLEYLKPDWVTVIDKGLIVKSEGDVELARTIEKEGFDRFVKAVPVLANERKELTVKDSLTKEDLVEVFKGYEDPELHIDVWTLGLIYNMEILGDTVKILLTFTSPMCPFGPQMVDELTRRIKEKGVEHVELNITFEPPWQPSEELRTALGV